ncbi:MAG: hotdog domain-containing protein [Actinomycetota bacterium]
MPIEPGAQARAVHVVSPEDTAVALGSGEVPVLASSRLIAWCEKASLDALAPHLPPESTTVAMRVHLDHLRPASVGCEITAIATLERIEGRRFVFVASALGPEGTMLAQGRIVRVIVETESFLASACGYAG